MRTWGSVTFFIGMLSGYCCVPALADETGGSKISLECKLSGTRRQIAIGQCGNGVGDTSESSTKIIVVYPADRAIQLDNKLYRGNVVSIDDNKIELSAREDGPTPKHVTIDRHIGEIHYSDSTQVFSYGGGQCKTGFLWYMNGQCELARKRKF